MWLPLSNETQGGIQKETAIFHQKSRNSILCSQFCKRIYFLKINIGKYMALKILPSSEHAQ